MKDRRTQALLLAGLMCLAVTGSCSLFGPRDSGAHDSAPAWSPDGKTIAYVRRPGQFYPPIDPGPSGLYLIGANGRGNRALLREGWYSAPTWSPDGKWLAFAEYRGESRETQIYKVKANGDSLTQLTFAGGNSAPAWSVTDRIAYVSALDHPFGGGAIWVMESDGSHKRPLQPIYGPYEDPDETFGGAPSWSPDGSRLVFYRWCRDLRHEELVIMDSAGQEQVRLTIDAFGFYSPAWSPDDGFLAVCRVSSQGVHILLLDLQTMEQRCLPVEAISLTWSPDGQKLCFEELGPPVPLPPEEPGPEVGRYLWIVSKDGTGLRRLTR